MVPTSVRPMTYRLRQFVLPQMPPHGVPSHGAMLILFTALGLRPVRSSSDLCSWCCSQIPAPTTERKSLIPEWTEWHIMRAGPLGVCASSYLQLRYMWEFGKMHVCTFECWHRFYIDDLSHIRSVKVGLLFSRGGRAQSDLRQSWSPTAGIMAANR